MIKAARMGIPLIASRTSATDLSSELAAAFGITLAGYVRGDRLNVYTHPERLAFGPEADPGPLPAADAQKALGVRS